MNSAVEGGASLDVGRISADPTFHLSEDVQGALAFVIASKAESDDINRVQRAIDLVGAEQMDST